MRANSSLDVLAPSPPCPSSPALPWPPRCPPPSLAPLTGWWRRRRIETRSGRLCVVFKGHRPYGGFYGVQPSRPHPTGTCACPARAVRRARATVYLITLATPLCGYDSGAKPYMGHPPPPSQVSQGAGYRRRDGEPADAQRCAATKCGRTMIHGGCTGPRADCCQAVNAPAGPMRL